MTIYDEDHGPTDSDERRAWKDAMYHAHYGSTSERVREFLYPPRLTLGQRFIRWWREDFAQSHHRGCGGKWEEIGTSGLMVIRIHYRCAKCGSEHYFLAEH